MSKEWSKSFNIISEGQKIAEDAELKQNAEALYKLKESFKKAGFTEAQSFNLLQTIIISSGGNHK